MRKYELKEVVKKEWIEYDFRCDCCSKSADSMPNDWIQINAYHNEWGMIR